MRMVLVRIAWPLEGSCTRRTRVAWMIGLLAKSIWYLCSPCIEPQILPLSPAHLVDPVELPSRKCEIEAWYVGADMTSCLVQGASHNICECSGLQIHGPQFTDLVIGQAHEARRTTFEG